MTDPHSHTQKFQSSILYFAIFSQKNVITRVCVNYGSKKTLIVSHKSLAIRRQEKSLPFDQTLFQRHQPLAHVTAGSCQLLIPWIYFTMFADAKKTFQEKSKNYLTMFRIRFY